MPKEKLLTNKFDQLTGELLERYQGPIAGLLIGVFLMGIFGVGILFLTRQKQPIVVEQSEKEDLLGETGPPEADMEEGESVKKIFVDIAGAVNAPGVYELPEGGRLQEAVEKAGGFSDEVDNEYIAKNLNLAQVLSDGEKVYIPKVDDSDIKSSMTIPSGQGQGSVGSEITGKININTASSSQLETLPGIGPAYAKRIIESRPYKSIEDIQKVSGIGPKTFEKLKDKIKV